MSANNFYHLACRQDLIERRGRIALYPMGSGAGTFGFCNDIDTVDERGAGQ
jgi:hypothetical protein